MAKSACVIVLGDIGRSPRMQYHSLSLAKAGYKVDVVGYGQTAPIPALKSEPLVSFHYLAPVPTLPFGKLLNYVFKTIWQSITLLFLLGVIRRCDYYLIQNPPAIPSLIVTYLYALLARSKFIIDWHNYAYSIMALNVDKNSMLVKITRTIERLIGQRAEASFCVSKHMKVDLEKNWNICARVLYDRPPSIFQPLTIKEKLRAVNNLNKTIPQLVNSKFFTVVEDNIDLRPTRPGVLVSSTSWTEDEDFSVLLKALEKYERAYEAGNSSKLCKLICIITGKGPLKEFYKTKISEMDFKHISVVTPWLEASDYPKVLGIADLGVCLHTSSSGLDLPMKVVDMFGCELPVCAYKFESIDELVKHNENGFVFENAEQLADKIQDWFSNFNNNAAQKRLEEKFKISLKQFQSLRWEENWENIALSVFQ